jgi:hypothetical protein
MEKGFFRRFLKEDTGKNLTPREELLLGERSALLRSNAMKGLKKLAKGLDKENLGPQLGITKTSIITGEGKKPEAILAWDIKTNILKYGNTDTECSLLYSWNQISCTLSGNDCLIEGKSLTRVNANNINVLSMNINNASFHPMVLSMQRHPLQDNDALYVKPTRMK